MTAPASPAASTSASGLGERLRGKQVVVCVGAGGVGKTTTSAALALGLALRGQKVAVVTIDPARRLASALGLAELPSRAAAGSRRRCSPSRASRSRASCGR